MLFFMMKGSGLKLCYLKLKSISAVNKPENNFFL